MEQVINILKPLKAVGMVDGTTNESPSATNARGVNVFASLESEPDEASGRDQFAQDESEQNVVEASEIAQAAPVLDDDELGQWVELSFFIYVSQALYYDPKAKFDGFRKRIPCWNASTDIGKKQRRDLCLSYSQQRSQLSRYMQLIGYLKDELNLQQMPPNL